MTDIDKFILNEAKKEKILVTNYMSTFYSSFCKFTGRDTRNINKNQAYIRRKLNNLTSKGYLQKDRVGTGYQGKYDTGFNHCCCWTIKDKEY